MSTRTRPNLKMVEGEILISLCNQCKCCLPRAGHCAICHLGTSIAKMCGCGECNAKADSFIEIEAERTKRKNINFTSRITRTA